jgi:hypothetical protein
MEPHYNIGPQGIAAEIGVGLFLVILALVSYWSGPYDLDVGAHPYGIGPLAKAYAGPWGLDCNERGLRLQRATSMRV